MVECLSGMRPWVYSRAVGGAQEKGVEQNKETVIKAGFTEAGPVLKFVHTTDKDTCEMLVRTIRWPNIQVLANDIQACES